ncbi:MAG: hypothetical protein MJK11_13680 [Pseudomonadales bacterium]|nr:hypothetical protein [Pseudomonadales bacterium]
MINEIKAKSIAQQHLISVVRHELGREKDILIGFTYFTNEGWLFRHDLSSDLMGGVAGIIAIDENKGEIIFIESDHPLAKRMKNICERNVYIKKHGYF